MDTSLHKSYVYTREEVRVKKKIIADEGKM